MEGGRSKLESWSHTLGAGSRGVMRAAGGLTLRRGEATSSPGPVPGKMVTISVVGLSGGEKDKGSMGVGKSCLCNRFVAPLADDYNIDHISVLSQSDFSGRVVNNDHFLYWGDVVKTNEEGVDFHIQVVEQTEFIDDASFQPFRASGKQEPYVRRCASTRIVSAEKLMYICKNQLGLEKEFEERLMPGCGLNVDGFICVFDVSLVPNRTLEKEVETTAQILLSLLRTKKPVVLVTTKHDEGNEIFVREAERLVNRKEFRGLIPIVETSAHENINVDNAFFLVATLVDRTRGRVRLMSYLEASRARRDMLEIANEQYARLIRQEVTDYGATWTVVVKKLAPAQEFQNFLHIFGVEAAQRMFKRHVKKLKDNYLSEKVARYLDLLPEVLHELFPDIAALGEEDWVVMQQQIHHHPDFDRWFLEYPEDTSWMEANLFDGDSSEHRIPFDVLDSTEAETVYKNLLNQLHAQQKRSELRKDFKQLLEETGYVTPGKKLEEVRVLFLGRECFESLPECDRQQIYDLHQQDLMDRCKRNFQELLLEKADIFYQFRSSPAGTVTHDDILDITEAIAEDGRYKALDRMDADRKLLLFQHLGFVHCPIREHCPAYPQCTDCLVERAVQRRVGASGQEQDHLYIILLGVEPLSGNLAERVRAHCPHNTFQHGGQEFSLELRIISGDTSQPQHAFLTSSFNPQGCLCIYSDAGSLEYVRSSLETTLVANLEKEDRLLPLIILFQPPPNITDKELLFLQSEGQNLAESLQSTFLEYSPEEREVVVDSLRSLVESIRHRWSFVTISPPRDRIPNPDIRVIMCLFCGDPFGPERLLEPLVGQKGGSCLQTGVRSVLLEQEVRAKTRRLEIILSSYHSATDFRDELVHGFILVYSTRRKASLATLSTFSMNIPELPIQVVGIQDREQTELSQTLAIQGNLIANQLNAHFATTNLNQFQPALYQAFLQEVVEKKSEIEKAFALDERLSCRLDDSGEGTLERPARRNPIPPPRIDSYHIKGPSSLNSRSGSGRSGSGSEIYERLPDSGSHADLHNTHSEDSDVYSQVDSLDRQLGGKPVRKQNGVQGRHQRHHLRARDVKLTPAGWTDDTQLSLKHHQQAQKPLPGDIWGPGSSSPYGGGAYTTGRRGRPSRQQQQPLPLLPPGKLNMAEFNNVSAALGRLQVKPRTAPLAAVEDLDRDADNGYAVPRDNITPGGQSEYAQPMLDQQQQGGHRPAAKPRSKNRERRERQAKMDISDSESDSSSDDRPPKKAGAAKRPRKKRIAGGGGIPVAPPQVRGPIPVPMPQVPPQKSRQQQQQQLEPVSQSPEKGLLLQSDSDDSGEGDAELQQRPALRPQLRRGGPPPPPGRQLAPFVFPPPPPGPPPPSGGDLSIYSPQSRPELEVGGGGDPAGEDSLLPSEKQRKKIEKELKLKQKEIAKQEKRDREREEKETKAKIKEEKKKEKQEKKVASRQGIKANSVQGNVSMDDFRASEDNPVPVFLSRTIEFIEREGLDAEGLYRVPGNRAHVDLLFAKFDEDKNVDLDSLDIAVNAVATAVKDFFFKRLPPLLPAEHMADLETISVMQDRHMKLLELKKLLERLPRSNHAVLKYIFNHFVRVTERSKENCMDSKNLAICWWPTLLQYEFGDLAKFETMRPHLEDVVQTLIDQFRFLFCGQEEVMMV